MRTVAVKSTILVGLMAVLTSGCSFYDTARSEGDVGRAAADVADGFSAVHDDVVPVQQRKGIHSVRLVFIVDGRDADLSCRVGGSPVKDATPGSVAWVGRVSGYDVSCWAGGSQRKLMTQAAKKLGLTTGGP